MAREGAVAFVGDCVSLPASADLSAKQYHFVYISGVGTVTFAAAATVAIIGILQNKPTSGEVALVKIAGGSKLVAGGVVTAGDKVTATSAGRALTTTTDTNHVGAIALETSATNGDVISALICQQMVAG